MSDSFCDIDCHAEGMHAEGASQIMKQNTSPSVEASRAPSSDFTNCVGGQIDGETNCVSGSGIQRGRRMSYPWGELGVLTNYTFLGGASHPEELVRTAAMLGHSGIALTDFETFGGAVRAHVAAKSAIVREVVREISRDGSTCRSVGVGDPIRLAHGVRVLFQIEDESALNLESVSRNFFAPPLEMLLYASDRASWGALCLLLTRARSHATTNAMEEHGAPRRDDVSFSQGHATSHAPWSRRTVVHIHDLVELLASHCGGGGILGVIIPPRLPSQRFLEATEGLVRRMSDRIGVALRRTDDPEGVIEAERACILAEALRVPVVALSDVRMHHLARRPLLDTLRCIRDGTTIQRAKSAISWNGERCLHHPNEILRRFADRRDAVENAWRFIERASYFSLDTLRYEYPDEIAPQGMHPMQHLRALVWAGARERYPRGVPPKVARQFEHEFSIIDDLGYAPYFLTVHEIVAFARSRGILCQGRGAAANSAVCFALGITAVDPDRIDVLFERFVSRERNEPPDIDIDFEHERREEVIQHIYGKYGRHRAALVSEIISYRGKSAVRDVGKVLGFAPDCIEKLATSIDRWTGGGISQRDDVSEALGASKKEDKNSQEIQPETRARLREAGLDPSAPMVGRLVQLVGEILGFPRHRSQHVGGFVLSRAPLSETVPIENAAMQNRTVLEWDKDDIEALGMLKIDILSLGMLTAIRKTIDLVNADRMAIASGVDGRAASDTPTVRRDLASISPAQFEPEITPAAIHFVAGADATQQAPSVMPEQLRFHTIPAEDERVYDMVCGADTIGVFQIESRAQMSMLPRLRPRCFYDLVVEVAIVRPGPIQGDMVHPYLRRRSGEEPIEYPNEAIREVLGKTLGVPLFQEQAMKLAVVAAGFSPGQADELRRAIAAWKRSGNRIAQFGVALEAGMIARGYTRTFATQVFQQIQGFSGYGFPESHAASFALLVYASAWLKRHHPAAFTAALLNSQPMGFYAPAQLIRDARDHGVAVRGIDVHCSRWDSTLERGEDLVNHLANNLSSTSQTNSAVASLYPQFLWHASENLEKPNESRSSESLCKQFDVPQDIHSHTAQYTRMDANVRSPTVPDQCLIEHWRTRLASSNVAVTANGDASAWCPLGDPSIERSYSSHEAMHRQRLHARGRSLAWFDPRTRQDDPPHSRIEPLCPPSHDSFFPPQSGVPASSAVKNSDASHRFAVPSQPAIRLGLRMIRGLDPEEAHRVVEAVARHGKFSRVCDLAEAANIRPVTLRHLASADAFRSMGLDRQQAMWQILALKDRGRTLWSRMDASPSIDTALQELSSQHQSERGSQPSLVVDGGGRSEEIESNLPPVAELSGIAQDFEATGVSLKRHPIACIRHRLQRARAIPCAFLRDEDRTPVGRVVFLAGLVLVRQRPSTAKGIVFMTIEDETGVANLIFRPKVYERLRAEVRHAAAIGVRGKVERRHGVTHLLVCAGRNISSALSEEGRVGMGRARDFH